METKNAQLHTERANTKSYSENDHRVHIGFCKHTRYQDMDYPALTRGTCLDCGAVITLGTWALCPEPVASDEELTNRRITHNKFWKGQL